MKKILSIFAALLMVASVSAQQMTKVNLSSKQLMTPTQSTMKYQAPKSFKAKKKAATVNATSGDQFVGKYVQDDWNYTDDYDFVGSTIDVAIEKSGDNYVIKNWYGYGFDITCTFADGKLVAQPLQVMYNHATYGNVGLCPWDVDDEDNIVADPEAQVSFSLKEDGSVEMDNFGWMMLILEGAYAGYNFVPYFMFTTLYPVTATAVDTDDEGAQTTYEVAVEAEDDVVYIHGLGQAGSVYAYPVDWTAKTGVMPDGQDVLYYNDQYGMFSTLGLVIQDGKFYLTEDGNTTVTLTDNSLTLGNYGFANESYALLAVNDNTVITLNEGVWPAYAPTCDYPEVTSIYDGNVPAEGEFFLYNVQLNKWLGDNDRNKVYGWTSHAEVTDRGRQFGFIKNGDEWQIDPHMGHNHSLRTDGLWMDTDGAYHGWTLTPYTIADGKVAYKISGLKDNGSESYLATNAGGDMDEAQHYNELWQLVTREQRLAMEAKTATQENPANFAWAINGGNFPVADDFWNTEWQHTFDGGNNVNAGDGGLPTWYMCNRAFESWNSNSYNVSYEMTNMPNGTYQLTLQGYYRDGSIQNFGTMHTDGTEVLRAFYFANDVEAPFMSIIAGGADEKSDNRYYYNADGKWVPDNLQAASAIFFEGGYWNEPITFEVTDGKITLGIKKEGDSQNGNWTVFDTFTLKYLGDSRFIDTQYGKTEDTNQPAVAVKALAQNASTVFVDKYNYNNVEITIVDENGDAAAAVVDTDDNYALEAGVYPYVTTCNVTTLILDQDLADGEYTITFPAGCLVQGEGANFEFNQADVVKLMKVDNSNPAKLVRVSTVNGISNVESAATKRIYNLQGVEVKNATRGLYIINGKKYIVK